jgi:hypothetical protein
MYVWRFRRAAEVEREAVWVSGRSGAGVHVDILPPRAPIEGRIAAEAMLGGETGTGERNLGG